MRLLRAHASMPHISQLINITQTLLLLLLMVMALVLVVLVALSSSPWTRQLLMLLLLSTALRDDLFILQWLYKW